MDFSDETPLAVLVAGYPRPMLCRRHWATLNGPWELAADPDDVGVRERWFSGDHPFTQTVQVPFPIGSESSGVSAGDCDVYWYRKRVTTQEVWEAGVAPILRINFEAVDYRADVWINGDLRLTHEGGYSPFSVDVFAEDVLSGFDIVVRVEDDPRDLSKPRGKQDWRNPPEGIWYEQSTGIWRDVWMERVPRTSVRSLRWATDVEAGTATLSLNLDGEAFSPKAGGRVKLEVELSLAGRLLARQETSVLAEATSVTLTIPELTNPHEWNKVLWSPEVPNLVDAKISLVSGDGRDDVLSYLGIRSVTVSGGYLQVNGVPMYQRGVLDQGYWAQSYFTPPSHKALEKDLRLAVELGFNMVRVHERSADPRYLTWADYLGVMVWGESASAYTFDATAMIRTTTEWAQIVMRDSSHPCVVVWVPFNESWGLASVATREDQRAFMRSVVNLTRAIDPSRPVISNDGWEHIDTDVVTVHDYGATYEELFAPYATAEAIAETIYGVGPQGRQILLEGEAEDGAPIMVSEFGGIALAKGNDDELEPGDAWGYGVVRSTEEFERALRDLFSALYESPYLSGVCYTQLTDTAQECNGLCDENREPKLPAHVIRGIVTDTSAHASQVRPRSINETNSTDLGA